jgi:hypothetical protein
LLLRFFKKIIFSRTDAVGKGLVACPHLTTQYEHYSS